MKTLILNGSPRSGGDTSALIAALTRSLTGEVKLIDCYAAGIAPCTDCRYCREKPACAASDGMEEIYSYLTECDSVVIASPVHYGELSAGLLSVASRFQVYSSALIFRHEALPVSAKRGAVLLAQGGSGGAERAFETARLIFFSLGIRDVLPPVCTLATDMLPASGDKAALESAAGLARLLREK